MAAKIGAHAFLSATAAAGDPAALTFPAMPGRAYRIEFIEASTVGGTGSTPVTITGITNSVTGGNKTYDADIPVDRVTNLGRGLLSLPGTNMIITVAALASSVPKLNVLATVVQEKVANSPAV